MAKIKMRCGRCGKKFTASSAKQTFCPECEAKLRAERTAAKAAGAKSATGAATTHAPKIVGPGASILVPGLAPARNADVPPEIGELGLGHRAAHLHDGYGQGRAPHNTGTVGATPHKVQAKPVAHAHPVTEAPTPQKGREKGQYGERTQPPRVARPPHEPKAPRPTAPVVALTGELRAKIEQRYLELAQPVEFDGIRTQIAGELGVPKAAVKRAVVDLRTRMQMPSWWELQTYTGGSSDLDRIRRAYVPFLPVPPIGVHKTIAQELGLDTATVYQGIKRVRAEMRLPRFNPPELHEGEPSARPASATQGAAAPVPTPAEPTNADEA